ncbi:MAG: thiolase domain-containing protein [Roseomonas sp.]|jgi:acetyl-CoA C-acetyltransferase|nr:thiolase domain-containing protein [Roseomonas sp.]MCA3292303.1 thiolase domain-containing protein [Roseomonas sp.]MCA3295606.1 thiolase domain-containing protein [Roseomonas sp.]MCA3300494.1 thiolase domain-containing protein [Roseomonas sp.]
MRQVSILGIGSTAFGRHAGTSIETLAVQAAAQALADADVARDEIGALYLGNFISGPLNGQEVLAGMVADRLGLPNIPCTKVEGACASGGIAFRHAVLAIASGQCDAALVVGAETMTHASGAEVTAALNCAMDNRSDGVSGLTFPGLFGMAWRIHAARYGTTRRQVSAVIRKNKSNGLRNPLAQMGAELTDDVIEQSPMICDPLQLYDCCPVSDGAAALVLVARDRARRSGRLPVDVLASVQTRGASRIAGHADLCSFDATVSAASRAYEMAGIRPQDVNLVELHDCFSIAEIVDSEDLGLIPRGQGAAWAAEGRTSVSGDIPINPSGGLLAKGHPVGATGVAQIHEAVLQLRGMHTNQVKNAEIAMTHNLGGTGIACTVNILRRGNA